MPMMSLKNKSLITYFNMTMSRKITQVRSKTLSIDTQIMDQRQKRRARKINKISNPSIAKRQIQISRHIIVLSYHKFPNQRQQDKYMRVPYFQALELQRVNELVFQGAVEELHQELHRLQVFWVLLEKKINKKGLRRGYSRVLGGNRSQLVLQLLLACSEPVVNHNLREGKNQRKLSSHL